MHSSKILFSCFLLLVGLKIVSAVERYQIDPNSFHEVNFRYDMLKGSESHSPLIRPWYFTNTKEETSLLFQLQPTLIPNGNSQDVSINSWIQLRLNKRLIIVNEMHLNYASQNDPSYIGTEWRSVSGLTNQSFLHWNKKMGSTGDMAVQAGRFYSQLGPGRHGQLLLGANTRPMDQLTCSLNRTVSRNLFARFFFQTSALDKMGSDKRFMSLHRLELISSKWYLALSEALTYARNNQSMDLVYLNPFILFHLEQLNGPDLLGNTIGTLEFGFRWNTSRAYSEILIDDVQFDNEVKGDLEPNEIGGLLGYEYASDSYYLSVEGVALTNRTYKTPNPSEWFLHRNRPIGYELGSDVGRLNVLSRYYLKENWHIDTEVDMIWQGAGEFSHPWDTPWEDESVTMEKGYSETFPTGVVEQTTILSAEMMRHWNRERWVSLGIAYTIINNLNHISDIDESGFNLHLSASWSLEYEAIFQE
jgi:hypothetical protein